MNGRRASGLVAILIIVLMGLVVLSVMVSCKTVRESVADVAHDTVRVVKADTVRIIQNKRDSVGDVRIMTLHDTTVIERERVIVIDEKGDTVSERTRENERQRIHEAETSNRRESHAEDFASIYSSIDSILAKMDERHNVKVVEERSIPPWQYVVYVGVVVLVLIWVRKSRLL